MARRHICIHGHFYQPPRENPWLEEIEIQDSAHPYHDWNHRISAECYARNATARILDEAGRIVRITNNYARMSFNVGPTLLSWMAQHDRQTYDAIVQADRQSRKRFSGHGSAMAQPYNHMILPLANTADRKTQIVWGIRDFTRRFGRQPEGMWLPETAVDLATLTIMARQGITFTILSPHQARRIRPEGDNPWQDVGDTSIDPRRVYVQHLSGEYRMAIFFYDGPISRDIAFGGLLNNGETLAGRLMEALDADGREDQLIHIATDGETFGHHHPFGDMALAYALEKIDADESVRLTNYGEFLAMHPPTWEVEIKENTAWSCAHGVARWKSDCGCNSGRQRTWNQAWRAPLRKALDWLRDALATIYTEHAGNLFTEPWQARNEYIDVILDRSMTSIDRFIAHHQVTPLDKKSRIRALKLLEMQRHAMLMYTSCGWFFDELSGIETTQVIQYAGRAVQLARELVDADIEGPFLDRLAMAKSNIRKHKNGRRIYEKWIRPARVDLQKTAAHYAISKLFEDYPPVISIFCYSIEDLDSSSTESGNAKISIGRARVTSQITGESGQFHHAVFNMGDHHLSCGIQPFTETEYPRISRDLMETFDRGDFPGLFQLLANLFPHGLYSLTSLFRDEQRKVLDTILESVITDTITLYRQVVDNHVNLMRFINESSSRLPRVLYAASEMVINHDLDREFERDRFDTDTIRELISGAERIGVQLDEATLEFSMRHHLERLARKLGPRPDDFDLLKRLVDGVEMAGQLPFPVRMEQVQNDVYDLGQAVYPGYRKKAAQGDAYAQTWADTFHHLVEMLRIRVKKQ